TVAHVDFQRQEGITKLVLQRPQAIAASAGADRPPAAGDKTPRSRLPEAGRRAGDEYGFGHCSLKRSNIQSVAVGQSSILSWACSARGTAGASRGSATMCSRQVSGECFATDAWWMGRSSTKAARGA